MKKIDDIEARKKARAEMEARIHDKNVEKRIERKRETMKRRETKQLKKERVVSKETS